MNITKELSRFVTDTGFEDLQADLIDAVKKAFLDFVGVTIAARKDPVALAFLAYVRRTDGAEEASILGYDAKTSMLNAALVNGVMSHILDYDDAHSVVRTHPSSPLIPAILAAGEHEDVTGKELITAYAVGYEVSVRLGYAFGKKWYEKGWHATPVLGRFGAAAGASKILHLNPKQVFTAFVLSAMQAGGTRDVFGTMGKPFNSGKASMDGLFSALLAREGFLIERDILSREDSYFPHLFSEEFEPRYLTEDVGYRFHLLETSFKPHAACLLIHPAIDGVLALRDKIPGPEYVDRINIEVAPLALKVTGTRTAEDPLQAKFSMPISCAIALVYGRATESFFSQSTVSDPSVTRIAERIEILPNEKMTEDEASISILLKNGEIFCTRITHPRGSPENPMTLREIVHKTEDLLSGHMKEETIRRLIDTLLHLEDLKSTVELIRICCENPC
jgi:2-methylcitrate dehydratase PrpD